MAASPEPEHELRVAAPPAAAPRRRYHVELLADAVFRPLARLLVRALHPLGVSPVVVVLANAAAGLVAVWAIARGQLVAGALLLQVKTVLDNADGHLARVSGRASALGRYLDTEADLVVNVALFAVLARETSSPVLAAAAFVALTIVLSAEFNEDALHHRARGAAGVTEPPVEGEGRLAHALAWLYRVVYRPQDRALQWLARVRLERLLAGVDDPERRRRALLAYHDDVTATVLGNLGLSTQLAILGALLVAGAPEAYLWFVLGSLALLPLLQLRRELVVRKALRS